VTAVIDSDQHLYETTSTWRDHIDPDRRGDARVLLLSLAFFATGEFLLLHAIGTTGILFMQERAGFHVAIPVGLLLAAILGTASAFVDMAAEGAKGLNPDAEMRLENTGHPAASSFTLAHASRSHVHAFGLAWDDVSGKNNGQYAPFSWKSA